MPAHQEPPQRDVLRAIRAELQRQQREIEELKAQVGKVRLDRGDHAAIPVPSEGEVMINLDDDTPRYYSNGEWREFAGAAAAPNLAMAYIDYAGETVTTGGWKGVSYDNPDPIEINSGYTNPAAEEILPGQTNGVQHLRIDTLTDGGGTKYGIYITSGGVASEPDRHGVYAITGSVEWDGTAFNGRVGLLINTGSMLPWNFSPVDIFDANNFSLTGSNFQGRFQSKTIVTIIQGGSNGTFCGLDVYHNKGSDYDFLEAGLIVKHVGWWSASEGTFFPA